MGQKILKYILALFYVLALLTIFGTQWRPAENPDGSQQEKKERRETQTTFQKNPEIPDLEINLY